MISTTWTLEENGLVGLGVKFNTSGIVFNNLGTQFGGKYIVVWNLQDSE